MEQSGGLLHGINCKLENTFLKIKLDYGFIVTLGKPAFIASKPYIFSFSLVNLVKRQRKNDLMSFEHMEAKEFRTVSECRLYLRSRVLLMILVSHHPLWVLL